MNTSMPIFQFTQTYNATADANTVVCLYPMSGRYELMQRVLLYALLSFSVFAQDQQWLVTGAFGSAMAFSGTAAVHGFPLAVYSRNSLPDLDMFGVWAVTTASWMIILPATEFSKTLRESPARPVFKLWGVLVLLGSTLSAVALLRHYPEEQACMSANGKLLTSPLEWNPSAFDCTYTCFSKQQPLRSPSDIVVVTKQSLLGQQSKILTVVLIMTAICAITCAFQFWSFLAFCISCRRQKRSEFSLGLDAAVGQGLDIGKEASKSMAALFAKFNIPLFVIVVVLNEFAIPRSKVLAFNEPVYTVGQWSSYVSAGLVVIALLITKGYLPRHLERQAALAKQGLGPWERIGGV